MPGIRYALESNIGLITLADKAGGNRLNDQSLSELQQSLEMAIADPSVRVIVIRAAGGPGAPWCLGMDLDKLGSSLGQQAQGSPQILREGRAMAVRLYGEVLQTISNCDKPVVACIGGPVKAGGVGLAAACDIIVASTSASFELSEVLFGLIPANVLPVLIGRRMSPQRARWLILSAKLLSASEAFSVGLADEIPSDENAESAIKGLCKALLRGEPGALAHAKHFIDEIDRLDAETGRVAARTKLLELMERPEVAAALAAFGEGSTPAWFAKVKPSQALFWEKED